MDIPVKYLSQIQTISALKVLIAFLTKQQAGVGEFEYILPDVCKDAGISTNSARSGIQELEKLGYIEVLPRKAKGKGAYRVTMDIKYPTSVDQEDNKSREGYQFVTAARKKKSEDDASSFIDDINFYEIELFEEDINSVSVFNINTLMTDKERGRLAKRIINEVHRPRINRVLDSGPKWMAQQMSILKSLLVKYRTEQIIGAIRYWTEIEEAPNGLTSLAFLRAKSRKDKPDNIMVALDYYKSEYSKHMAPVLAQEEAEKRRVEQLRKERDEKQRLEQEKKAVEALSNDDFVSSYLGQFAGIANKLKKSEGQ